MTTANISFSGNIGKIEKKRVRVYIDWFNFYHNLKEKYPDKSNYKWINYRKLVESYLSANEKINWVYFFTAYYTENKSSHRYQRHKIFNRALMANWINIILWTFIDKYRTLHCGSIKWVKPPESIPDISIIDWIEYHTKEEKKTDVNLAVKIVEDSYEDRFDIAYIATCDTDIVPAIFLAKKKFPNKRFINLRIANSIWRDIQEICDSCIEITKKDFENAIMEDEVIEKNWNKITIPTEWKTSTQPKLLK